MNRIATGIVSVVALLVLLVAAGNLVEVVDSSHATRVQYPWGTVTWYTDAQGPKPQVLGKVTTYDRRGSVTFVKDDADNPALSIDFNDRGIGTIEGSINYELTTDHSKLEEMYKRFKSQEALEVSLIRPAVSSGIYLTGQLMSSFESYSTRKAELVNYVEDQAQRGVYLTRSVEVVVKDELDPTKTTTAMKAEIVADVKSPLGRARQSIGEADRYGIRIFQFAIKRLDYNDTVNKQIEVQQGIMQRVNTSRAEAVQAQQEALTAKARGEESVARAEADQKTKNAYIVEAARGLAAKAEQDKVAAEAVKQARILTAQGEAEAARLKVASGLTPQERAGFELEKQKAWANAMANSTQPLVPSMVVGGGGNTTNAMTGWQAAMEAVGLRALQDLARPQQSSVVKPQPTPTATAVPTSGRGGVPQQARGN